MCVNCRPKLPELYQKHVGQTSKLQIDFARLWTQCQRCQGSLHQVRTAFCSLGIAGQPRQMEGGRNPAAGGEVDVEA